MAGAKVTEGVRKNLLRWIIILYVQDQNYFYMYVQLILNLFDFFICLLFYILIDKNSDPPLFEVITLSGCACVQEDYCARHGKFKLSMINNELVAQIDFVVHLYLNLNLSFLYNNVVKKFYTSNMSCKSQLRAGW